jgi:hypothetical protein
MCPSLEFFNNNGPIKLAPCDALHLDIQHLRRFATGIFCIRSFIRCTLFDMSPKFSSHFTKCNFSSLNLIMFYINFSLCWRYGSFQKFSKFITTKTRWHVSFIAYTVGKSVVLRIYFTVCKKSGTVATVCEEIKPSQRFSPTKYFNHLQCTFLSKIEVTTSVLFFHFFLHCYLLEYMHLLNLQTCLASTLNTRVPTVHIYNYYWCKILFLIYR